MAPFRSVGEPRWDHKKARSDSRNNGGPEQPVNDHEGSAPIGAFLHHAVVHGKLLRFPLFGFSAKMQKSKCLVAPSGPTFGRPFRTTTPFSMNPPPPSNKFPPPSKPRAHLRCLRLRPQTRHRESFWQTMQMRPKTAARPPMPPHKGPASGRSAGRPKSPSPPVAKSARGAPTYRAATCPARTAESRPPEFKGTDPPKTPLRLFPTIGKTNHHFSNHWKTPGPARGDAPAKVLRGATPAVPLTPPAPARHWQGGPRPARSRVWLAPVPPAAPLPSNPSPVPPSPKKAARPKPRGAKRSVRIRTRRPWKRRRRRCRA